MPTAAVIMFDALTWTALAVSYFGAAMAVKEAARWFWIYDTLESSVVEILQGRVWENAPGHSKLGQWLYFPRLRETLMEEIGAASRMEDAKMRQR